MISRRPWMLSSMVCASVIFGLALPAGAVYIDGQRTLKLSAKVQSRFSLRMNDSEGFTFPDVTVGDLVQQRNLALLEIDHDLKELTEQLDLLYPLRALRVRAKYHLVGRFLYEGIYDYGPEVFQDVQDRDRDNIESFKQSYDLWECYLDLSRGPIFFRVGRQNLSWGETDLFRLLDNINPLDNTFGGPFEDLDDRRIPLWMLRGSYNFGDVGPIKSLSLESFWVPGFWDVRVAPWAPKGTPYSAPLPEDLLRFLRFSYPGKNMDNSRWGFRVMGLVGSNLNMSIGHYRTFLDTPALRAVVTSESPVLIDINALELEASYEPVHITGAAMNYFESYTNVVFRGEVGWFWDEPVLIPQKNLSVLYGPVLPLPDAVLDEATRLFGLDVRDLGLNGLPLDPQSGTIPTKDFLRYMIGLDKQFWVRPLNSTTMFFLSLQYFGQWVPDYDKRMRQGLSLYPNPVDFAAVKETEHVVTSVLNTSYEEGTITPQLALAYDVRGAWLIQPSVNYIYEPFRISFQYSIIEGRFTNFGAFRDRDQITLILSYLLP
ncbi:MAG: DUF1302 family protein [bacterium]